METLADVLYRLIDLVPWREETDQRRAREIVTTELVPATPGAHEAPQTAEGDAQVATETTTEGAAGKGKGA